MDASGVGKKKNPKKVSRYVVEGEKKKFFLLWRRNSIEVQRGSLEATKTAFSYNTLPHKQRRDQALSFEVLLVPFRAVEASR